MQIRVVYSVDRDDNAAVDPERVREMLGMLDRWRDPVRPDSRAKRVPGQDYEPKAIGHIYGNVFTAEDVADMLAYVRKLVGRGRAALAGFTPGVDAPAAVIDGVAANFALIERMARSYEDAFQESLREAGDLPAAA